VVVIPWAPRSASDPAHAVHQAVSQALAALQAWLADERLASSRLVVLTQRAIATQPNEDVLDLVHAPLWGLTRSAQAEYPDRRILLVDLDDTESSRGALPKALACRESQLAVRQGHLLVPKLARIVPPSQPTADARALEADGTVLITGAM